MSAIIKPGVGQRIARALRKAIVRGQLKPGDALPSERELAVKYEVNRSSIREAMTRLETWGLVRIRQGGATRVSETLLNAGLELLPHLVAAGGEVDPAILGDLHEIRGMLLGWCAEQAAKKADASSITRLDLLVRRMVLACGKPAVLQELDYDFFQALVDISGNRVLGLFSNVVRDVYLQGRERFLGMYESGVFDVAHHQRAVEAIRARKPKAAFEAMRAHAATALMTLKKRA